MQAGRQTFCRVLSILPRSCESRTTASCACIGLWGGQGVVLASIHLSRGFKTGTGTGRQLGTTTQLWSDRSLFSRYVQIYIYISRVKRSCSMRRCLRGYNSNVYLARSVLGPRDVDGGLASPLLVLSYLNSTRLSIYLYDRGLSRISL